MMITYPGLTIEPLGDNTLMLRLDAVDSDDGVTPRPTTHAVIDPPADERERIDAIFKAVGELAQHEVAEWFRVDGVRWRAPHEGQRSHPRVYLKAHDFALVRAACVVLAESFTCPVDVILVGSVLERPDFADIDVRFRIPASDYQALPIHPRGLGFWMTEFAAKFTGLPVDIQLRSDAVDFPNRPSLDLLGYRGSADHQ